MNELANLNDKNEFSLETVSLYKRSSGCQFVSLSSFLTLRIPGGVLALSTDCAVGFRDSVSFKLRFPLNPP